MTINSALGNFGIAPRLLTREQAAAYCGVGLTTFTAWVMRGIVPGLVPALQRQSETKLAGPMAPQIAPKERRANASASTVAVYDGRDCIGTIKRAPKGDSVAYDDPGQAPRLISIVQALAGAFK
jgi:hypothetical protein